LGDYSVQVFQILPKRWKETLKSLFNIWQGRLYNYYVATWNMEDEEAFKEIDKQAKDFIGLRKLFTKILWSST